MNARPLPLLNMKRGYATGDKVLSAVAELTANAGTQFDPEVVQSLVGYLVGRRLAGLEVV